MRVLGVLAFAVCAASCSTEGRRDPAALTSSQAEPAPPAPAHVTVASYNILYSLAEKHADRPAREWADADTLRTAAALEADVVVFQEVNEAWEGALRAVLGPRYPHCAFHMPVRYAPEGLGACARYPITADATLPSPLEWFPAQRVVVELPSGPVQILNVHLRPAVAGPEDWWRVHREMRPLRAQEIARYLRALDPSLPSLVVGDFNELSEGELFGLLDGAGFDNALARAHVTQATWQWAGTTPPLEAQIDHLAYRRDHFALVDAKVLAGGHSDHVPLVVDLLVRAP